MSDIEMAAIGAMVAACMEEMGFGRSRGAKAIFSIACCGAMCEKEARPWSAAGMAHEYARLYRQHTDGSMAEYVASPAPGKLARQSKRGHILPR